MREGLRSQTKLVKPGSSGSVVWNKAKRDEDQSEGLNLAKKLRGSSSGNANLADMVERGNGSNQEMIGGGVLPSMSMSGDAFCGKNNDLGGDSEVNRGMVNGEGNDKRNFEDLGNPPKDEQKNVITAMERIESFQNRTKGYRHLTTIHGQNMMNASNDGVCPNRSLRKEILEDMEIDNNTASPMWSFNTKDRKVPEIDNNTASTMLSLNSNNGKVQEIDNNTASPILSLNTNDGKVLETENNEASPSSRLSTNNVVHGEGSRSRKTKQEVKEEIMKLLEAAGWIFFFPPTNGIEVDDYYQTVYLSPELKAHWSITIAYSTLKKHYETGDGEGKVYEPGFQLKPIPDEDLKVLAEEMDGNEKSPEKLVQSRGNGGVRLYRVYKEVEQEKVGCGPSKIKSCGPQKRRKKKGQLRPRGKLTVLFWMIKMKTIKKYEKVHYVDHEGKCAVLDGEITGDGILCGCCNEIVSILEFEAHSGSKVSDPLKNIYVKRGTSLLQCLLETWNKQDESDREDFHVVELADGEQNDYICVVCGQAGYLVCCDSCTLAFHKSCLNIKTLPSGDWYCIYCRCKFCGSHGANQMGNTEGYFETTLFTCRLCDQKYHKPCLEASGTNIVDSHEHAFLCGNRCKAIFERLNMLLGVKNDIGDGFSVSFIRRSDISSDASQIDPRVIECNSKLAVALSIMKDCFNPYIDFMSGIATIDSVLYNRGSNFTRLDCKRFFTAILERGDEIISVATIRIHPNKLAEMPYVATYYEYRKQGMFRRLLNAIEYELGILDVELLIIPAIPKLKKTWIGAFGFEPLDSTSKKIVKKTNLLVFPHSVMLQKRIAKHNNSQQVGDVSNPWKRKSREWTEANE